jgi:Papain family cysteine protease/Domain of unknown function (DUF4384)
MKIAFHILSFCLFCGTLSAQNQFGTGCLYDSMRYEKVPLTAPLMRGEEGLPKSASLRNYCPVPGNQGIFGTCTAWASAYASRSILIAQRNREEENVVAFSPSYVYNQVRLTSDCDYGVYISDALDLLKKEGCAPFTEFGYDCERKITEKDRKKAKDFVIQDYKRLFVRTGQIEANAVNYPVKKALSEGKPVVISMRCFASFENAKDVWEPAAGKDQSKGYHAMAVVGYDDEQYGGAFQLMNSWGTTWGRGGFAWVRYADFAKHCMEAYEIIDYKQNPNSTSVVFGGEMNFKKSDGNEMKAYLENGVYRMNEPYFSGTAFQFYISHLEPAYLYAIGTDLSGKCSLLFPYNPQISPMLSYKNGKLAFPDTEQYIQLDEQKGKDFICVLYSQKPLDIQVIMKKMEGIKGEIDKRIEGALGKDNLIPNIKYDRNQKIGFRASYDSKKKPFVVPLVVEIRHE